jgi:hypothetical protein
LRPILFVLSFASLLAAAQEAAQPASTPSKALVYVYRYKQFVGSALAPSVYCDETQLARMENGRYFTVKVDAGKHIFRSNDAQSGIALDVKAGQEYYIRVEIATGFLKGHGRLILTAAEQGRYELKSTLKPLDSDKVADTARVSVEEVKFDTPLPAPPPAAPPAPKTQTQNIHPPTDDPPVSEVVLSDSPVGTDPLMSVGEAARQARQKKVASNTTSAPQ